MDSVCVWWVCGCVCEWEWESEPNWLCMCACVYVCMCMREPNWVCMCVCVSEREPNWLRVCVRVRVRVWEREPNRLCVCVRACVRERERESQTDCVCACEWVCVRERKKDWEREGQVCVSGVCVRERERERKIRYESRDGGPTRGVSCLACSHFRHCTWVLWEMSSLVNNNVGSLLGWTARPLFSSMFFCRLSKTYTRQRIQASMHQSKFMNDATTLINDVVRCCLTYNRQVISQVDFLGEMGSHQAWQTTPGPHFEHSLVVKQIAVHVNPSNDQQWKEINSKSIGREVRLQADGGWSGPGKHNGRLVHPTTRKLINERSDAVVVVALWAFWLFVS